jgi:predicted ATPase
MTQFALKSIHPVNLLSFGPNTEPIEVRPLNILIGSNGSGKSNLIEAIRLLHFLPDKDPWRVVLNTGGVDEWLWKGPKGGSSRCSLGANFLIGDEYQADLGLPIEVLEFRTELEKSSASLRVKGESLRFVNASTGIRSRYRFNRAGSEGGVGPDIGTAFSHEQPAMFPLAPDRSIFSQLASPSVQTSGLGMRMPEVFQASEFLESFNFHQDWEFGVDCAPRDPQPVGQSIDRLEEDGANLAQMLAYYRDNHKPVFEKLNELVGRFYEPAKGVEVRLISTHLEIAVEEKGGYSTTALRLSDGMLRWLYLLGILLNPAPAPVTCIDEPELGLHPDILPTLADLLRDASTRTQLIVTTHSSTLIDAFSELEDAESVCVTEKIDGSTVIRRLKADELAVWLREYSLGGLWTSGQIGGNRW